MQSTERSSTSRVPRAAFLRKNWRIIETNDVVSFCCTTGESALCTHMPLPPTTPSPTRLGQSENQSELPVLYSSFPPAIYAHMVVDTCQRCALNASYPFLPPLCSQVVLPFCGHTCFPPVPPRPLIPGNSRHSWNHNRITTCSLFLQLCHFKNVT